MQETDDDRLSTMSLARIGEKMDFGDMVGTFAITASARVPPDTIHQELVAVGNDGTFFNDCGDELVEDNGPRTSDSSAVPAPCIGARVRIRRRQRIGGDRYANREGIIVRSHFAGFYVRLDMTARERTQKTELVETAFLEVLAPSATEGA